jgi:hypothetical protein
MVFGDDGILESPVSIPARRFSEFPAGFT